MPPVRITSTLNELRQQVDQSTFLLESARSRGTPFFQLQVIAELSFLRAFLAWECYLEEAFSRLLCGARTTTGRLQERYARPRNMEHARQMFTLGVIREPRYIDWTNPEGVLRRAELLFRDGGTLAAPIRAAYLDLVDMNIIRDCIAHRSEYSRARMEKLTLRRLGVAYKYRPGRLLLSPAPNSTQNFLQHFAERIVLLGEQVVL